MIRFALTPDHSAPMLKQLTLQNFVLVSSLDIDLHSGLTTITGESGAGKSILLAGLGLLLGDRAKADMIRPDAEMSNVCAEFDLTDLAELAEQLREEGLLEAEQTTCLVRRVISRQGRSRAFLNGVPVTTQYLKQIGDQLVDIHGQHDHLQLAHRNTQLRLLDDYAKANELRDKVTNAHRQWQSTLTRLTELKETLAAAQDRQALLQYQLAELEELALAEDEFTQLESDHKKLSQAHHTLSTLEAGLAHIEGLDDLRQQVNHLNSIDDDNDLLHSARSALQTILALLDDSARDLRRYQDTVTIDPASLANIESRLNQAQDLARKHKVDPNALAAHVDNLRLELDQIDANADALTMLSEDAQKQEKTYLKQGEKLSRARRKAAPGFAKQVSGYLNQLGIKEGTFEVAFEESASELGLERANFLVTTNPKFDPAPLAQVASGGEQTRIALAVQIVAAQHTKLPCLILDEADVGVGGTTADTVGRILRQLGQHTQVICITHAPQVAALGDHHLVVNKAGDHTAIHVLDADNRVDELARMLAGADVTDKTRDYAATLLMEAAS